MGARANNDSRSRRGLLRVGALVGAAAALVGCAPSWPADDWSGESGRHLHKTEVLRFVADADCAAPWPFDPSKGDFRQVLALRPLPEQPWRYVVQYQGAAGVEVGWFDVTQWWTAARTRTGPALYYDPNRRCGLLVDVPRATDAPRPYYVEDEQRKAKEYHAASVSEEALLWALVVVFGIALVPCWFGFEALSAWGIAAAAAVLILAVGLGADAVCVEVPWRLFQAALAYERWFDDLPRTDGALLPLDGAEFAYLLRGPPSPASTHIRAWPFFVLMMILGPAWLVGVAPAIVGGLYWWRTPLPLEEAHDRALAEGRAPTVEELDAALFAAIEGKKAWQIDIMRRKAEAFVRRFARAGVWPQIWQIWRGL